MRATDVAGGLTASTADAHARWALAGASRKTEALVGDVGADVQLGVRCHSVGAVAHRLSQTKGTCQTLT